MMNVLCGPLWALFTQTHFRLLYNHIMGKMHKDIILLVIGDVYAILLASLVRFYPPLFSPVQCNVQ